jgi:hypothetical protein
MDTGGIAIPVRTIGNLTKNRYQSKIAGNCGLEQPLFLTAVPHSDPEKSPVLEEISPPPIIRKYPNQKQHYHHKINSEGCTK